MPIRVFYLDDEVDLCENFKDYLSSDEIFVTTFTDPATAVKEANSNPPDLIFIDFRLPGTTGEAVAGEIHESIPKYLVTGDISISQSTKFKGVLNKPYNLDSVMAILLEFQKNQ